MPIQHHLLNRLKNNDPTLTGLSLSGQQLTCQDIQALVQALATNTTLSFLDVQGNQIGDEGAKALAATTLSILYVNNNHIGAEGAKALATNATFTTLDISGNQTGAEGAKALAANTTLTTLYMRNNQIGDEGTKALATNTILTTLDVNHNEIGDEGAKALAANAILTTLYVRNNQIGDEGATALATNTTLTILDASANRIGDEGAKALAANATLTSLHVGDNQIGDEGAKALAANTTLISLHVGDNQIRDEGAKALAANTTLTYLNAMSGNKTGNFGFSWQEALSQKIAYNRERIMLKRRDYFIQIMITLVRDSVNPNSRSIWQTLPKDIRLYILSFVPRTWSASLGKTPQQVLLCMDFIFNHLAQLQEALVIATSTRQGLKVMEKRVGGISQFRFFPSPSDRQAMLTQKGNTNRRKISKCLIQ